MFGCVFKLLPTIFKSGPILCKIMQLNANHENVYFGCHNFLNSPLYPTYRCAVHVYVCAARTYKMHNVHSTFVLPVNEVDFAHCQCAIRLV